MEQNDVHCPSIPIVGKNSGTEESALVNIRKILAELKAERSRLNRAIVVLEKLQPAIQKERGSRRPSEQRRRDSVSSAPRERRGELLMFRKPKVSRSKPSKAEEA